MQDRYVGDVGYLVKHGLLRAVEARKRLGHPLRRFAEGWKHHGELVCERPSAAPQGAGSSRGPVGEPVLPIRGSAAPTRAAEFEPDPVIEAYKRDIDRTLLRQNLRRSVTERVANLMALQRLAVEARRAGRVRERERDRDRL